MRLFSLLLLIELACWQATAQGGNVFRQDDYSGRVVDTFKQSDQGGMEDRYIVLLHDQQGRGLSTFNIKTAAALMASSHKANVGLTYSKVAKGFSVENLSPEEKVRLEQDPSVKSIIKDEKLSLYNTAVVQATDLPWGLDRLDDETLDSDGTFEHQSNGGEGVHVYIIDTGVNVNHVDFQGRIAPTSQNKNFVKNPTQTPAWNDCHGHGTHVASSAAGTKYGVAKKATIHAVRIFDCEGSTTYAALMGAMDFVAQDCNGRLCVANMSLGSGKSSALNEASTNLVNSGVVVTVAAGNENQDACNFSPASADKVITVGSTTSKDERSYFSNFGSCLNIYAPVRTDYNFPRKHLLICCLHN